MAPNIFCNLCGCTWVVTSECSWLNRENKRVSGSNMCIRDGIGDYSKVAMEGSSKGDGNIIIIGLDLLLERLEVVVSEVASYFTD